MGNGQGKEKCCDDRIERMGCGKKGERGRGRRKKKRGGERRLDVGEENEKRKGSRKRQKMNRNFFLEERMIDLGQT